MKTTKNKAKTTIIAKTWLPVFAGFYGNIWDDLTDIRDEEIEYINEERQKDGLALIDFDDLEIDYKTAHCDLSKMIFNVITGQLEEMKLITSAKFDTLRSPREYNFHNDSINCTFELSKVNVLTIAKYLDSHNEAFKQWLKDKFTSRSGFSSFHYNYVESEHWTPLQNALTDSYRCGAILEFILLNEDFTEEQVYEVIKGNYSINNYYTINEPSTK